MKCSTCKYWVAPDPEPWMTDELDMTFGKCVKTKHDQEVCKWSDDYDWVIVDKELTAVVQDGSGYMARLLTKADHGCTMWSEK